MASPSHELPDGRVIAHRISRSGGGWVATYEDITERRRRSQADLYGAPRHADRPAEPRCCSAKASTRSCSLGRNRKQLAVLCLDLDSFKNVNDTLGHPIGDEPLRAVAERLVVCTAIPTSWQRLGGDEFANVQADHPAGVTPRSWRHAHRRSRCARPLRDRRRADHHRGQHRHRGDRRRPMLTARQPILFAKRRSGRCTAPRAQGRRHLPVLRRRNGRAARSARRTWSSICRPR